MLATSMTLHTPEAAEQTLTAYKQAVGNSGNADVKRLLGRFEKSTATYKKYAGVYDLDKLKTLKTDGLLVPGDDAFWLYHGNGVYVFKFALQSRGHKLSQSEIVTELSRLMHVVDTAEANLANKNLSQSPAPTFLGKSNKVGQTYVLEPCTVLSPAVFSKIAGHEQNDFTFRTSVFYDLTKDHFKDDKSVIIPSNNCERRYERYNDPAADPTTSTNVSIPFYLQYFKSARAAQDYLTKNFPLSPGDTQLQTKADWAAEQFYPGDSTTRYYPFRVGPYVGRVSINTLVSASNDLDAPISQGQAGREQYISAINELVTSLKAQLQAVKQQ